MSEQQHPQDEQNVRYSQQLFPDVSMPEPQQYSVTQPMIYGVDAQNTSSPSSYYPSYDQQEPQQPVVYPNVYTPQEKFQPQPQQQQGVYHSNVVQPVYNTPPPQVYYVPQQSPTVVHPVSPPYLGEAQRQQQIRAFDITLLIFCILVSLFFIGYGAAEIVYTAAGIHVEYTTKGKTPPGQEIAGLVLVFLYSGMLVCSGLFGLLSAITARNLRRRFIFSTLFFFATICTVICGVISYLVYFSSGGTFGYAVLIAIFLLVCCIPCLLVGFLQTLVTRRRYKMVQLPSVVPRQLQQQPQHQHTQVALSNTDELHDVNL
jgi:cation transport ATPase